MVETDTSLGNMWTLATSRGNYDTMQLPRLVTFPFTPAHHLVETLDHGTNRESCRDTALPEGDSTQATYIVLVVHANQQLA